MLGERSLATADEHPACESKSHRERMMNHTISSATLGKHFIWVADPLLRNRCASSPLPPPEFHLGLAALQPILTATAAGALLRTLCAAISVHWPQISFVCRDVPLEGNGLGWQYIFFAYNFKLICKYLSC